MAIATQASPMPNCARLSDDELNVVRSESGKLLAIWMSPQLSPEAKLWYVDDVAKLFRDFGQRTLATSIDWYRQNHSRTGRPTIAEIRSKCSDLAGSKRKPRSQEMEQYDRDLKEHPEDHPHWLLTARDVFERVALKQKRKQSGNPMTEGELEKMRREQLDQTFREWRQADREGRHFAPQPVVGMQKLFEMTADRCR